MTPRDSFFKPMVPANLARCCGASMLLMAVLLFFVYCGGLPVRAQEEAASAVPNAITQVAEGAEHACALTREGRVLCWGGQYGLIGIAPGEQFLPLPITGITETIARMNCSVNC